MIRLEKYCPKCGEPLPEDARFCRNCGFKFETPQEKLFKKNQRPIMFVAIVLITAIITIAAVSYIHNHDTQKVEVGSVNFKIPSEFKETNSTFSAGDADNVILISKIWQSQNDTIMIAVMHTSNFHVGADAVNSQLGGKNQTLMGQEGTLHETDGIYYFSFVKHGMLISVYASDMDLYDKIEVL